MKGSMAGWPIAVGLVALCFLASAAAAQTTLRDIETQIDATTQQKSQAETDLAQRRDAYAKFEELARRAEDDKAKLDSYKAANPGMPAATLAQVNSLLSKATADIAANRAAMATTQGEINTLNANIAALSGNLKLLSDAENAERLRIKAHMDCIARSRSMLRFVQYATQSSPESMISAASPKVAEDIGKEFQLVRDQGMNPGRHGRLMDQVLAARANAYFDRIRTAVETEATWSVGSADYQRAEALSELATIRGRFDQALGQARQSGDCAPLADMITGAERIFWSARGNYSLGASETMTGHDFNLMPQ